MPQELLPGFDAVPVMPAGPRAPELSRAQRLTVARNAMIAQGVHPATLQTLSSCETCGTCRSCRPAPRGYRCSRSRVGSVELSDVRVSWPACAWWKGKR